MSHEIVRELAAAYAIGALDRESRRELERHLADCAPCAAEARSLGEVAAMLGVTVVLVEPSPSVRARLMRRVGAAQWA